MKKKEIIIVIALLIISSVGYGIFYFMNKNSLYANVVYHNPVSGKDELLLRFDVNKDAYYEVEVEHGKYHIEVKDGKYRAIDVDCPNQTCVGIGWVPTMGYYAPIVCIPNGISIQIEDAKK